MDKSVFMKLLTSPSYQKQLPPIEDINGLKTTQQRIQEHIEQLASLNLKFHKKQEQSFLIAFTGVMDKMAQELLKAKRKYEDIDLEIRRHEICSKLEKELVFYKRDNTELRTQLNAVREENNQLKQKNAELKSTVSALKNTLRNQSVHLQLPRSDQPRLSRMSAHHFKCEDVYKAETEQKTVVKIIDFRKERKRAESNLSRRGEETVLKTKPFKDPSCDLGNLGIQVKMLWRQFKQEYPDIDDTKPKSKGKIVDLFTTSTKMRKLIRSIVLNRPNEE